MEKDPIRFTEAEWRVRDAQRECSTFGHDWVIISNYNGPISMHCSRPCNVGSFKIEPMRKKED